jgi:hypothetical protein
MAFSQAKADRMNQLAQQYPRAPLGTLASLANIPVSELGNYTTDSVGTRASNANFGRVTSEESQNVQSTKTARNTVGSGSAFTGTDLPPTNVSSVSSTPAINPFTGRAFETPPTPVVQPQDDDVDFTDAYGDSYREVTPIPPSTRRPGVEQAQPFQPPQSPPQDYDTENELPGDDYDQDFRTADDIARANRADVPTPTPRPDINAPEAPPARPAQEISQVDDFSGTPVPTQVDDFADINTPTEVDDFSGYSNNNFGQVDDFAEINTPTQVDDFSGYSNNDFGTEDPGLDAFGPGPTPPAATNTEYDQTQFDPFGDVVEETAPAQVDDFADYSDNNFGAQVDDFSELNTPAQVDDFADYSDNDFGIEEEDFSDFATPEEVNPFGVDDFGDAEAAQFDEFGDPIPVATEVVESGEPIVAEFDEFGNPIDPQVTTAEFDEFGNPIDADGNRTDLVENDGESLVGDDPVADIGEGAEGDGIDGVEQAAISEQQQAAIQAQALKTKAQQQQTISEMREASGVKNADGDWRVKLRLAPQATYLYQAPEPGILAPLTETDGIIFPYTPSIDIQYRANYQEYSPTHSNYQHYFYQGSNVAAIQMTATFTAQDTIEAEYLLAVIHFLKSCSKMFYGNDAQRGSPPPLLYLSGLGEYQFNESPCVVSEFNYNLPNDVNYIRARSKQIQRDGQLQYKKPLATSVTNGNFSSLTRLQTAVTNAYNGQSQPLEAAAQPYKPAPGNLGSKGATYVPTKMDVTLVLNPIVSRKQVSQQFSLKEYANGNLIKKGMW